MAIIHSLDPLGKTAMVTHIKQEHGKGHTGTLHTNRH